MRILVEIDHPKDVNTFKNIIRSLEEKGHIVKIAARNKENVFAILDDHGFKYESGEHYKGLFFKAVCTPKIVLWLYRIAKKFNPDVFVGPSSLYSAYASKLLRKPYICFTDVEKDFTFRLMMPFTDAVLIPSSFERNLGRKEVRFNSYIEHTYLHPNNFKPNPAVLNELNLSEKDRFILMRISSLDAFHDVGAKGLNFRSTGEMLEFIKKLKGYGNVFLTSEIELNDELEKYKLKIPINDLLNCICYSTMYIGDGASMAAEAAVLGVPSIYVTNTRRWGFINDLEKSYGLLYTVSNSEQALEKAVELLEDPNLKEKWQKKREKMLSEKIDAAKFFIEFIENYAVDIRK